MKTTGNESNTVHMPPDLPAEARQAANEEHRPADELVSDAVRRYLQQRKRTEALPSNNPAKRTLLDLFAPLRGLDVEFTRNPSTGRKSISHYQTPK